MRRRLSFWKGFAAALLFPALAAALAQTAEPLGANAGAAMVFILGVLVCGVVAGLWPALAAAGLSALLYNFLLLSPRFTLWVNRPEDLLTLVVFFAVAFTAGGLAGRVRDQALKAGRRAAAVSAMLEASRRMSGAASRTDVAQTLAEQLSAAASGRAAVFVTVGAELVPLGLSPPLAELPETLIEAARSIWERGEGAAPPHRPKLGWTFHGLLGLNGRSGIAAVEAGASGAEEERFVLALLDQGAVALERAEFAAEAAEAEALRRSDRLRTALLNSVSHDLRTPLATVLGSTTTLLDYGKTLTAKVQRDLLESIREEAERLNRYVGDLLDMSRLEGGALVGRRDWTDVREVLAEAGDRVSRRLGKRRLIRDFPPALSLVKADPGLLEQALVNILENAIAYSPDESTIEAAAYEDRGHVVISIEDQGRGIPAAELERVFEKFRRMEEASDRGKGAGLGLAIAKGFVEAMGGRIAAASPVQDGGGARILISLRKEIATAPSLL